MNVRTYNDRLTVVIVSFHSNLIIENLIHIKHGLSQDFTNSALMYENYTM